VGWGGAWQGWAVEAAPRWVIVGRGGFAKIKSDLAWANRDDIEKVRSTFVGRGWKGSYIWSALHGSHGDSTGLSPRPRRAGPVRATVVAPSQGSPTLQARVLVQPGSPSTTNSLAQPTWSHSNVGWGQPRPE
jgi:hypothetical protein